MDTTMNGLHSCKPGNEPTVGETKHFTIEQRIGKSGKPWTKIKADREGQPYRVVKAVKTDFVDDHGNVSFNLEIEPSNGTQSREAAPQRAGNGDARDDTGNRIERQHSQEMAIRYIALRFPTGVPENMDIKSILRDMIDWFQRDVGRMPVSPAGKPAPEPEHDDAPEPDEEESF